MLFKRFGLRRPYLTSECWGTGTLELGTLSFLSTQVEAIHVEMQRPTYVVCHKQVPKTLNPNSKPRSRDVPEALKDLLRVQRARSLHALRISMAWGAPPLSPRRVFENRPDRSEPPMPHPGSVLSELCQTESCGAEAEAQSFRVGSRRRSTRVCRSFGLWALGTFWISGLRLTDFSEGRNPSI